MAARQPPPRGRSPLLAILFAAGALAALALAVLGRGDAAPTPTHAWSETVAGMEGNPSLMLAFLAERVRTRDGKWDYRWMSHPARTLWATLRYEYGRVGGGSENPSVEEAAEAYAELGLAEAAALVRQHGLAGQAALAPLRTRIAAARRTYAESHRGELEKP